MLPNSTERAVTISGGSDAITQCVYHICCVMTEVKLVLITVEHKIWSLLQIDLLLILSYNTLKKIKRNEMFLVIINVEGYDDKVPLCLEHKSSIYNFIIKESQTRFSYLQELFQCLITQEKRYEILHVPIFVFY